MHSGKGATKEKEVESQPNLLSEPKEGQGLHAQSQDYRINEENTNNQHQKRTVSLSDTDPVLLT